MNRLLIVIALSLPVIGIAATDENKPVYYGSGLCNSPQYECIKVGPGQSWEKLFPDEQQRDLVQRINRSYNSLWSGKEIVVPRDLAHATMLELSPFPQKIDSEYGKQIIVDQDKLAWAGYDEHGQLVKWGPISSGSDKCSDNSSPTCRTMTGIFQIFSKENIHCKSNVFPIGKGGAKMPYCMYFHKGLALHGSDDIPGYRASHGCVRMFTRDAKWLNEEFVDASNERNNYMGTTVTIRPVTLGGKPISPVKTGPTTSKSARATYNGDNTVNVSASAGGRANSNTNAWVDPDRISSTSARKQQ